MKGKRNETSNLTTTNKFLLLHLLAFILLFLFLTPKVSARLFPFVSGNKLNTFIQETESSKTIDPRNYWEFREFYSPGSFHFSKTGLPKQSISPVLNKADLSQLINSNHMPFLLFTSPKLESVDFLTDSTTLESILPTLKQINTGVVLKTNTELIYRKDSSTLVMVFLKNHEEMKSANGFFDYRIADKKLTEGKYWFNVTVITQ